MTTTTAAGPGNDCNVSVDIRKLGEPFPTYDLEWRVQQSGLKNEKPYAMVLAYVTNRAVQDRLDFVVGPLNWRNEFEAGPSGGVLCGLSIRCDGEWITKWDGAENTAVEGIKGGLSSAMKRAAVQWGIGRYLYNLDDIQWANFNDNGQFRTLIKKKGENTGQRFNWDPPPLPDWAKPGGRGEPNNEADRKPKAASDQDHREVTTSQPAKREERREEPADAHPSAVPSEDIPLDELLATPIMVPKAKKNGWTALDCFQKDPDYGTYLIEWFIKNYDVRSPYKDERLRAIRALKAAHSEVMMFDFEFEGTEIDPTDVKGAPY